MPLDAAPPTLYDVAREAGVSLATASRVLNGSARMVAEQYRAKVLEAATRLGYSANLSAQAIARGTSAMVALLVGDIADPFFSSIAAGVGRAAERHGMLMTIAETARDPGRELALVRQLAGLRPRLLVLAGSRFVDEVGRDELQRELEAVGGYGGRVVLIGQGELPFDSVAVDNAGGARSLAGALVQQGHRRFAVLAGPPGLVTARDRLDGFRAGLSDAGIDDEPVVVAGDFTRDGGFAAIETLLTTHPEAAGIDAVFAVNDVMAIGALAALRAAGVDVPGRLAVAGFDDIPAAVDAVPALTTVRLELEEAGERAVAFGVEGVAAEMLTARVVLRASSGA